MNIDLKKMTVTNGRISLKDFDPAYVGDFSKGKAKKVLKKNVKQLSELQELFYADNRYSLLLVLQASDAAGKDGAIRHVMSGVNPQGCRVNSFKQPSKIELEHDFFWRHYKVLPEKGIIGIFNRSHYENVLVTKVHPEYIMGENIPGIDSVEKVNDKFGMLVGIGIVSILTLQVIINIGMVMGLFPIFWLLFGLVLCCRCLLCMLLCMCCLHYL